MTDFLMPPALLANSLALTAPQPFLPNPLTLAKAAKAFGQNDDITVLTLHCFCAEAVAS